MNCDEIEQRWVAGEPLDGAELRAHLETCAACRELHGDGSLRNLASAPASSEELGALRAVVDEARHADDVSPLGRLASWPTPRRLAAMASLIAVVLGFALVRLRPDFHDYSAARMAAVIGVLLLLAAWLWAHALRPLYRAPAPAALAVLAVGALAPWLIAALPEAQTGHAASHLEAGDTVVGRALSCLVWGGVLALPLLAAFRVFDRLDGANALRTAPALVAANGIANVALQLHCPLTEVSHLLLGHASVGVALALAWGAVVHGRRLMSITG